MATDILSILENVWSFIEEYWLYISTLLVIFVALIRNDLILFIKRLFNQSTRSYYKRLLKRLENEEPFDKFPDLKLRANSLNDSSQTETLSDLIKTESAIHIQGKPGSGKTSLLKKYLIDQCKNRSFFKRQYIPIYIKYSSEDLFSGIFNSLIVNDFIKNPSHFDINWLKNLLKRKRFLLIIDDVHNLFLDEQKRSKSKIDRLKDYSNNQFILISRDYYSACPFQFKLYEIEDLSNNRDKAELILKIHSDEGKFQRVWMHLSYGYKKELLQLYNTPQLIKLLAKVFDQKEHFDDNKSFLFKRFLKSRHEEEARKLNKPLPFVLKEKVLGSVAYELFIENRESAYSISNNNFRVLLNKNIQKIQSKYGFHDYSIDLIIEGLKQEGYLIQIDGNIQFEHDQWQEFFAALDIYQEEKSIKPFLSFNYGKEIALFVSGLYLLEDQISKKYFWQKFWEDLVINDFFLTNWCLDNRASYTVAEFNKVHENFSFDKEEFFNAYSSLLNWYEKIIHLHFPNLSLKFSPTGTDKIGILVEQNEKKVGQSYSYRPVTKKNNKRVIVTNQKIIMDLNNSNDPDGNINYYHKHYGIDHLQSYIGTSAIHSYPVELAFRDVLKQLSNFIREGNLVETEMMQEEALYIEAVSLSKMLKGRRSEITNPSKQYVLTVGQLLEGIKKIKADEFGKFIKVPGSSLSHYELSNRDVSIENFELKLNEHISKNRLSPSDKLVSPNSDLIEVLKNYRFDKDKLTPDHKSFLMKRSIEFYTDVYQNYKQVLELNFPTGISHFQTKFPVQIILVKKGTRRDRFGEKIVFFDVNELPKEVNIKAINKNEEEQLKSEYKGYHGVGIYWGLSSFSMIEPVRNSVYQLIKNEYDNLIRETKHRV